MKKIFIQKLIFLLFSIFVLFNEAHSATIIISSSPEANKNLPILQTQNETKSFRVQIVKDFLNCAQIHSNQCIKCQTNYLLNSDKKCSLVSPLCRLFNLDQGICIQCYNNRKIIDGVCYHPGQEPKIKKNCMIWSEKQCLKCQKAFYLQNGVCQAVDIDFQCRKWDLNGLCLFCNQGYFLTQQKCVKSSNYIECPGDEYFSKNNECSYPPQNCLTWDPFNGKCVKCQENYDFIDWKCIKAQKVNIPIKEKEIQTISIQNCFKMNEDNSQCILCKQNYILDTQKGSCIEQIIKCKNYTNSDQCISCIQNFKIDENLCQLKPNMISLPQLYGCQIWNLTQAKCFKCQQKQFLLNKQGYCVLNEDHCQQITPQINSCSNCQEGYKVIGGNCQVIAQREIQNKTGCKLFDWVNNICLICEDQFIKLDSGVCQKPILNCFQQKQTQCKKCLPNHELKNGQCIPFSVSKCVDLDSSGVCKKCQNSFALIQGQCRTFKQLGTILLDYIQFSPEKLNQKIIIFTDKIVI